MYRKKDPRYTSVEVARGILPFCYAVACLVNTESNIEESMVDFSFTGHALALEITERVDNKLTK